MTRSMFLIAALALPMAACAPQVGPVPQGPIAVNAPPGLQDQDFANKVTIGTTAVLELSKVAVARSRDPNVSAYANRMATDYSQMLSSMQALAAQSGQGLPTILDGNARAKVAALASRSGYSDRAYAQRVGDELRELRRTAAEELAGSGNAAYRSYAGNLATMVDANLRELSTR